MNKIIYDIELLSIKQNEDLWNYYYGYTKQIKNKKDCVKLSLYCAKYCYYYNNEITKLKSQKYIQLIELIESWLINPNSVMKQDLLDAYNAWITNNTSSVVTFATTFAAYTVYNTSNANYYAAYCLYWCSKIENINMNLICQYLQTLLRTIKQFNIQNCYSQIIDQIAKQDINKLELVDYNMLLDISNEHYNIDLSNFCYDNIFSRRNLIEIIRREYFNE